MAAIIDRFKHVQLLQGAADAFVQATIETEITPEDGAGWALKMVELQFSSTQMAALSADGDITFSMSRDTKSAICGFDDPDCIFIDGFAIALTTSGSLQVPLRREYKPAEGTIFVEPTIYCQLDSAGTGLAIVAQLRLHYELVKLSEIEILRLLQNA